MEISPYTPDENLATILQPALEIDEKVSMNVRRRTTRVRSPAEKPWITKKKSITERIAQILPFVGSVIGILLTAYYVYAGYTAVPNHKYCLVLEDNFQALDTTIWSAEKVLGGYRNGDFQYYSDDAENLYVQNNQLSTLR